MVEFSWGVIMGMKATTIYDYKTYKKWMNFHMKRGRFPKLKGRLILGIVLFLFLMILLPTCFAAFESGIQSVSRAFIPLLWFILLLSLWFLYPRINFQLVGPNLCNSSDAYTFRADEFYVSSNSPKISSNSQTKYDALYKVYETDTSFYLYINLSMAYIVEKDKIENGTPMDLRNLIKPHLPPKKYRFYVNSCGAGKGKKGKG